MDGIYYDVRVASRSIPPQWGSIRFRLLACTYAQWGCIVRVGELTKSRKMPTRNVLPLVFVGRASTLAATACSVRVRAVQFHPHGGQSDFVWLSARTEGPHGGASYVW